MPYKDRILAVLTELHWELVAIVDGDEWWSEEMWKLRSVGEARGRELFIAFLVDPIWTTKPETMPPIWYVRASSAPLENRLDTTSQVASIQMQKGRFDEKLEAFGNDLQSYQWT